MFTESCSHTFFDIIFFEFRPHRSINWINPINPGLRHIYRVGRSGPNLKPVTAGVCDNARLKKRLAHYPHSPSPGSRAGPDPPTNDQAVLRAVVYVLTQRPTGSMVGPDLPKPRTGLTRGLRTNRARVRLRDSLNIFTRLQKHAPSLRHLRALLNVCGMCWFWGFGCCSCSVYMCRCRGCCSLLVCLCV